MVRGEVCVVMPRSLARPGPSAQALLDVPRPLVVARGGGAGALAALRLAGRLLLLGDGELLVALGLGAQHLGAVAMGVGPAGVVLGGVGRLAGAHGVGLELLAMPGGLVAQARAALGLHGAAAG